MSSGNSARTDVWDVNLDNNSNIAGGFIIVPYNWFNYANGANVENSNMINATFNGHSLKDGIIMTTTKLERSSGILLHPTSFPGPDGIEIGRAHV